MIISTEILDPRPDTYREVRVNTAHVAAAVQREDIDGMPAVDVYLVGGEILTCRGDARQFLPQR
jgi:hypothetical protein